MLDISIDVLVETIKRSLRAQKSFALICFWLRSDATRDDLQRDLEASLAGVPAIPVILRSPLFIDPNAWAFDVVRLIGDHRKAFEQHSDSIAYGNPCALIIIARSNLSIGQSSSPATLPDWFPKYGGTEVTALARDLRDAAACSLKDPSARIDELSEFIFRLEATLSTRVSNLLVKDKHHGQAFWSAYLQERTGFASRSDFVSELEHSVASVTDVRSFRPSLRTKASLVATMWSVFVDEPPARLSSRAKQLSEFLGVDRVPVSMGNFLFPILFRGANDGALEIGARYCRDLVVVVGASCQLATASAHADQYGLVHADLLRNHSCDARRFLSDALELFAG